MGAGAARKLRDTFGGIDRIAGELLSSLKTYPKYGLLFLPGQCGLFQVKYDWRDSADLELIDYSTQMLCEVCDRLPKHYFDMNYPGVGNGGLKEADVRPIIKRLPDTVTVWKLP